MYLDYWQLNTFPFESGATGNFYFATDINTMLAEDIRDAIMRRKGIITLTGPIGCGKSTLTQRLLLTLPEDEIDIALITFSMLSSLEMLEEICLQLGIEPSTRDRNGLVHSLQHHMQRNAERGRHTLVCIDEAQSVASLETFEELRLLLNFQFGENFLLTLFFIGQPELQDILTKLPQLKQRIALNLNISNLSEENTVRYILHRLYSAGCQQPMFTRQAVHTIFLKTGGVPRRINHLADRCLTVGMRSGVQLIDSKLASAVAEHYPC